MATTVLLGSMAVAGGVVSLGSILATTRTGATGQRSQHRKSKALLGSVNEPTADMRQAMLERSAGERLVKPGVNALADRARRFTPAGMISSLERRVELAGVDGRWPIERVLAAKLVGGGLGFEAAVDRLARAGDSPLKRELARMIQEVRFGISRRQALDNLVRRTQVADLRKFVHAVAQADVYGIPIGQVLRVQSGELRAKRRQSAEEKAMKVPVKVMMPLVLCILPSLFIVILGPAGIRIARTFTG
jgi:hypothetical protein